MLFGEDGSLVLSECIEVLTGLYLEDSDVILEPEQEVRRYRI